MWKSSLLSGIVSHVFLCYIFLGNLAPTTVNFDDKIQFSFWNGNLSCNLVTWWVKIQFFCQGSGPFPLLNFFLSPFYFGYFGLFCLVLTQLRWAITGSRAITISTIWVASGRVSWGSLAILVLTVHPLTHLPSLCFMLSTDVVVKY